MDAFLNQLANKLGILYSFHDNGMNKREYLVSDKIIKFFVNKLGYKAGNVQEIAKSMEDIEKRRWQKTLESIYIKPWDNLEFDIVIPEEKAHNGFDLFICDSKNKEMNFSYKIEQTDKQMRIGKTTYTKLNIVLDGKFPVGYYQILFKIDNKVSKSVLAVAPDRCFENKYLYDKKLWGYSVQLYSVRSERNWGVGDFTDLGELVKICARSGADILGINPINVLQHNYPEEASPYQSISRLFLNPIYIDVEAVPEFNKADKKDFEKNIELLRECEYIKYTDSYELKIKVLKKLYVRFVEQLDPKRHAAFAKFCVEKGEALHKLALFQTIYGEKSKTRWGGWPSWEEEYKNPNSLSLKTYAKENEVKLNFFKFLQFEADRQFKKVGDLVKKSGLKIGLYRDLAVGVGQDSCELWSDPDLFIQGAGAGAPPDAFFTSGQKWGLGAFNPFTLKERAYEPFIKILRANMQNAGALRIDHVMSLLRLYVIPENEKLGTYIMYNFSDMLNLVAIESHLNECTVVGESIGNVPEGFLNRLETRNIYSLSVLWAERYEEGWGYFKPPYDYEKHAFVSVGTHDMHPLRCWWFGHDIKIMHELGMIPSKQEMEQAYQKRENDRWKLLATLDSNNVWPHDNLRKSNYLYGDGYPEGIEEAVHRLISRSNSEVFLAELENILHVEIMQNLPGTDKDKYPNWRHKLPVSLEKLETDIAFIRNINAIKGER